ncbi:LuxR family transcriptional regulator [Pleomorphomonas carboxyditropha]|uniref:HTH luxR-type domain-containing protein n=1 Tax=Pleomorphomonas carboxyditropha TaxID=2023338 RepID=A0A2G9X2I6_9HYPH|nr:LuxR family transcriptional regulator [Pleomorphomonas carboxyditropha]PIP00581.1 hypothetical protein CJ014_00295 [Pleomorphomonas carboxyditropha]
MQPNEARLDRAVDLISSSTSIDALQAALFEIRDLYCAAHLDYHPLHINNVARTNLPILSTTDRAWISHYQRHEFVRIDPMVSTSRKTVLPIDWQLLVDSTKESRFYFSEMRRFDIGSNGIGIPINGAQGDRAIFTVTSHVSDCGRWEMFIRRCVPELVVVGRYLHEYVMKFIVPVGANAGPLSRQEHNCLQLFADGHDAAAIADMLKLSIHTVRMHLRRSQRRLGAASRPEAVAIALVQGFIKRTSLVVAATAACANFWSDLLAILV